MEKKIIYKDVAYLKHPKQKYFYCSEKNKRDSRSLHRQIFIDNFGFIPDGFHVHHKDGDQFNNDPSNLEAISSKDHMGFHSRKLVIEKPEMFIKLQAIGIKHAAKWHKSPEGLEWHKNHALKTKFWDRDYGTANCDNCNTEFKKGNAFSRFCSNNCKSAWRRKNNPDLITTKCENCESEFITQKYSIKRFCSKQCRPIPNPNGSKGKKVKS